MQKDAEKFRKAGIQLVGVSYDKVGVLEKFAAQAGITFPLLSDEGSNIIKALDIEDRRGLPHSGTILVNKKKQVAAKIFYDGYRKRHPNEELVAAAKSVGLIK